MPVDRHGNSVSLMLESYVAERDWLTFTALIPNSSVKITIVNKPPLCRFQYRVDGSGWKPYGFDGKYGQEILLAEVGSHCQFRAESVNPPLGLPSGISYHKIGGKGRCRLSGSLVSLLSSNCRVEKIPDGAFYALFYENENVDNALPMNDDVPLGVQSYQETYNRSHVSGRVVIDLKDVPYNCLWKPFKMTDVTDAEISYDSGDIKEFFYHCRRIRSIRLNRKAWSSMYSWVKGIPLEGDFYCPAELPRIFDDSHIPVGWTVHSDGIEDERYDDFVNVGCFSVISEDWYGGVYEMGSEKLPGGYCAYVNCSSPNVRLVLQDGRYQFTNGTSTLTCRSRLYSPSPSTWCGRIPLLHDTLYTDGSSDMEVRFSFADADPLEDRYLCLAAESDGSGVRLDKSCNSSKLNAELEYRFNNGAWKEYTWSSTSGQLVTLPKRGDRVKWRAKNQNHTFSMSMNEYYRFSMNGKIAGSGSIMTLLDRNDSLRDLTGKSFCFYFLFQNCGSLVSAPLFPATVLEAHCYRDTFQFCTNLIFPPSLPAKRLAECCYGGFLNSCFSLKEAPELHAVELGPDCYIYLFWRCRNIHCIHVGFHNWGTKSGPLWGKDATAHWTDAFSQQGDFHCPADLPRIFNGWHIPPGWTVHSDGQPDELYSDFLNVSSFSVSNAGEFDGTYEKSGKTDNGYPSYEKSGDPSFSLKPVGNRYQFSNGKRKLTCATELYSPSPDTWAGKNSLCHDLTFVDSDRQPLGDGDVCGVVISIGF